MKAWVLRISLLTGWAVLAVACATTSNQLTEAGSAHFSESALSSQNPAPEAMRVPQSQSGEAILIDPLYLRSQADYHFTLGESLSLDGAAEKAINEFKLTLVYDPNSAIVRLRLATEYVKMGLVSEGLEQAEIAVKADPKNPDARIFLASLYTSLKMYDLAMDQYSELAKIDPSNTEAPIYIGALLAEQKKYPEAIASFEKVARDVKGENAHLAQYYVGKVHLEQDGAQAKKLAELAFQKALNIKADFDDAVLALAEVYEGTQREDQATKLLSSFQEKFGPEERVAYKLSQIYLAKNEYEKALVQLEILEQSEEADLNTKMKIAMVLIQQKKFTEAIVKLEQILSVIPESDKVRFYLAAVHEEMGEADLSIRHYSQVPFASSYYGEAMVHAAYLEKQSNRIDKGISLLKDAISKRPDIPQLYSLYASLLDEKRDYKTAATMLADAVEKFPTNTQIRFFYGSMLDRIGKPKECISEMKKILELDENHAQALNYLAYTYAEMGTELDQAEAWAKRALELQPNDPFILDTVGWVYFKRGDVAQAIRYLEKAFQIKSDESVIAEHLGDAYNHFQLPDKARKMYLRAVESETDEKKARSIREKIASIERQQKPLPAPERVPASAAQKSDNP